MNQERRTTDRELGEIHAKLTSIEDKLDEYIARADRQCDARHEIINVYMKGESSKMPVDACNTRMKIIEDKSSRHTFYWTMVWGLPALFGMLLTIKYLITR